jgi:sugar phosphate isomerase/epimerase
MGNTDNLSIQLYTLRSLGELDRILDTVKQAGYEHVETVGSQLDDAENVRTKLDGRGLKVSSGHVSLAALRERPDVVVQACRTLGFDQLFMPAVPPEQRQSDAPFWRALGSELGEIAERMRGQGDRLRLSQPPLRTRTKGGREDRLGANLRGGGGQPTRLAGGHRMASTGRCRSQGVDAALPRPRRLRAREGYRATGANEDQDGWAEIGAGVLDWRDLWQATRAAGARWMVVEHDKPADPAETAHASYAFISRMGV